MARVAWIAGMVNLSVNWQRLWMVETLLRHMLSQFVERDNGNNKQAIA
jgi:hypothetical protein